MQRQTMILNDTITRCFASSYEKPSTSSSISDSSCDEANFNPFDSMTSTPWVMDSLKACESNLAIDEKTPRVSASSLSTDSLLGQGGFCSVFRVFRDCKDFDVAIGESLAPEYALKCLNPAKFSDESSSASDNEQLFVLTAADLALEASLLATLDHENIIKLRGVPSCGFRDSFYSLTSGSFGFFLLMDVLDRESLSDVLKHWRKNSRHKGFGNKLKRSFCGESQFGIRSSSSSSSLGRRPSADSGSSNHDGEGEHSNPEPVMSSSSSSFQQILSGLHQSTASCSSGESMDGPVTHHSQKPPSLKERFDNVACGIVNGLAYVHSKNIVFRDLKPSNVGFDAVNGTVKLFDFGLARRTSDYIPEIAGSFRYMAPEMISGSLEQILDNESNKDTRNKLLTSIDVYSFGVLLWELSTIRRPYSLFFDMKSKVSEGPSSSGPPDAFMKKVVQQGWRHSVDSIAHDGLGCLIEDCWNPEPNRRPTMAQIQELISSSSFKITEERSKKTKPPPMGFGRLPRTKSDPDHLAHMGTSGRFAGGGIKKPPKFTRSSSDERNSSLRTRANQKFAEMLGGKPGKLTRSVSDDNGIGNGDYDIGINDSQHSAGKPSRSRKFRRRGSNDSTCSSASVTSTTSSFSTHSEAPLNISLSLFKRSLYGPKKAAERPPVSEPLIVAGLAAHKY